MTRLPPPVLALTTALAQRAVAGRAEPPTTARTAAAGTLALVAFALAGSAAESFRRQGTTHDPTRPADASVLVTTGANALTRNPMYVGLTGLLVANAIRSGSWRALLPVLGFVVFLERTQVAAEETALRARFGADYDAYCAAVPRWVGRAAAVRA